MIRDFYDIDLSGRNSFHVRQRAARLVEFETTDDLTAFFRKGAPAKWTVLAGGNNILFTQDFDGVLLTPRAASIDVVAETPDAVAVRAEAGVEWDDLVAWAVERDLWGIENLSLIPGKVGAAPVQNIGAYGAEAKDAIESVEMFCTDTCNTLILSLRNIREAVCAIRRSKLPDTAVLGNAGSFFKNPVVEAAVAERLRTDYPALPLYPAAEGRMKLAAGWLIEQAGMKGHREGCVGVHDRQALVLVNYGDATGGEVLALAHKVQEAVRAKFGVEIAAEVNVL